MKSEEEIRKQIADIEQQIEELKQDFLNPSEDKELNMAVRDVLYQRRNALMWVLGF